MRASIFFFAAITAIAASVAVASCSHDQALLPPALVSASSKGPISGTMTIRVLGGLGSPWRRYQTNGQNSDFQGVTPGPDGAMWVADYEGQALWRIQLDGKYHRFDLGSFSPQSIVVGSDGDFYLNSPSGTPAIARVTTRGRVTLIPLPEDEWSYGAMVVGPDHDVWITEQRHVARLSPSGVVTQYPAPGQCDVAQGGMAVGRDGRVWYTASCPNDDEIAGVDPKTGKTTAYAIASGYQCPPGGQPLVAAADGALWFACNARSGLIGRITLQGHVRTYPVNGFALIAMANGADKDLWYVDDLGTASLLGRIEPESGEYVTYTPPSEMGRMQGIVSGPGPAMWMSAGASLDVYRLR